MDQGRFDRYLTVAALVGLGAGALTGCAPSEVSENESDDEVATVAQAFSGTRTTVSSEYGTWRTRYVEDVAHCGGVTPCKRVARRDEGNDTVSEGIGYGMLLAAYLDDRATLDGLWNYYRTHVNSRGVMHWRWSATNSMTGENEATDAIEDSAIALIVADRKGWGTPAGDSQTYDYRAKDLIGKILQHFITANNDTKPGDAIWDVWERTYNPSYMIAPYATVFATYTGNTRWNSIKDRDYYVLGLLDNGDAGARTTGLVPDWMYFNGTQNYNGYVLSNDINWDRTNTGGSRVWWFSYDACRSPWRLAMDWAWHADARAGARLDKINAWASPKAGNIVNGYYLNGTEPPTNEYPAGSKAVLGAFVGPFAAASVKASQSYQDTMWNKLLSLGQGSNYFSDTVRMLGLAFTSGNMPNPLSIGSGGGPTPGVYYSVQFKHSGKCQDVNGASSADGASIIQWACHGGDNQKLKLVDRGGGYYALQYKHSAKCTDINGGGTADGAYGIQWGCHYNDNQLFELVDRGGGYYAFKFKHSGKCIDVNGGGTNDGAQVIQWTCHYNDNQLFKFLP